MPPKDVKHAKKLYAKMKKEQKKSKAGGDDAGDLATSNSQETSPDSETNDGAETSPAPEAQIAENSGASDEALEDKDDSPEKAPTESSKDSSSEPQTAHQQVDTTNTEMEASTKQEAAGEKKPFSGQDASGAEEASTEQEALGEKKATNEQEASREKKAFTEREEASREKEASADEAIEKPEEPTPTSTTAKAAAEQNKDAKNKTTYDVLEKNCSSERQPEQAHSKHEKASPAAKAPVTDKTKAEPESESAYAAELVELRQENEDLKQHIAELERKVRRLQNEINVMRQPESASLSPQFPEEELALKNRNRASSFVEADLYSEAANVNARNERMKKWKGYQVDLRSWTTRRSFGPIVTV